MPAAPAAAAAPAEKQWSGWRMTTAKKMAQATKHEKVFARTEWGELDVAATCPSDAEKERWAPVIKNRDALAEEYGLRAVSASIKVPHYVKAHFEYNNLRLNGGHNVHKEVYVSADAKYWVLVASQAGDNAKQWHDALVRAGWKSKPSLYHPNALSCVGLVLKADKGKRGGNWTPKRMRLNAALECALVMNALEDAVAKKAKATANAVAQAEERGDQDAAVVWMDAATAKAIKEAEARGDQDPPVIWGDDVPGANTKRHAREAAEEELAAKRPREG